MKRFHTPSSADAHELEWQLGAAIGYYRGRRGAELFARALDGNALHHFYRGVDHGQDKRREDESRGKVVRL